QRYADGLKDHVLSVPDVIEGGRSVWAQYVIEHENRDELQAHLGAAGIPSAVYYPVPIHMQDFAARYPMAPDGLPVTEAKAKTVIALPMHPYLSEADQDRIIDTVRRFSG
ncbi:MAG: DegT/DnrJ/EryC1/StrS family aminotransferase, partial [Pseudomonadota bacterium]